MSSFFQVLLASRPEPLGFNILSTAQFIFQVLLLLSLLSEELDLLSFCYIAESGTVTEYSC